MGRKVIFRKIIFIISVLGMYPVHQVAAQETIKIMPLGNSITVGYTDGVLPEAYQTSYRFGLYYQLLNAGYNFDFVGSEISGWGYFTDCQHAGIDGSRDQYVARLLLDGYDVKRDQQLVNPPGPYLDVYDPDVILLHIGTNDITHEGYPGTANVSAILDLIDEYELRAGKEVTVFLALIINRMLGSSGIAETSYFNDQIRAMAEARIAAGDNIVIVDMEHDAGMEYTSADMTDWLHPNSVGYNKMASLWFSNIAAHFNQAPVINPPIPDQVITQGESFSVINLDNYVSDVETPDENITWTIGTPNPVNLNVTINANRQATITVKDVNWFGSESVIFIAEDNGINGSNRRSVTESVRFTVNEAVNTPPVIDPPIPDQTKAEGAAFDVIDLDFHVSDAESQDSEITWTVPTQPTNFTVTIDAQRQATVVPKNENWNGSETITFKATDNGVDGQNLMYDTDQAMFTVTPVNDAPVFTSVPVLTATEDAYYSYKAEAYDVENQPVSYYAKQKPGWLNFNTGTHILSGTPGNGNVGDHQVILTASDGILERDQSFTITVQNVNDIPSIVGMAQVVRTSKNVPVNIELEDLLVEDPDNVYPDDFTLSIEPGTNYTISGVTVYPDIDYLGNLSVPVRVYDGSDYSPFSTINVQVVLSTDAGDIELSPQYEPYPNPTSGIIHFRIPGTDEVELVLFNPMGSRVLTKIFRSPEPEISVNLDEYSLPPGVLIYQIRCKDAISTGKIMIQ